MSTIMTRVKKTRSLKRIHKVKTGNAAKLKRAAGHDRQTGKRVKNRVPSVYEKFLTENPEAREQAIAEQKTATRTATTDSATRPQATTKEKEPEKPTREKSLLDQLDSKDFKDIY